jgi:hypothetical protein
VLPANVFQMDSKDVEASFPEVVRLLPIELILIVLSSCFFLRLKRKNWKK